MSETKMSMKANTDGTREQDCPFRHYGIDKKPLIPKQPKPVNDPRSREKKFAS